MRAIPVLLMTAAALTAVATAAAATGHPKTSERYAYSTFRERTDRVVIFVDGYPASLHPKDGYIPVPVAVAVYAGGRSIPVSPETFTLLDSAGHEVHAASYPDLTAHYAKMEFDRTLVRQHPIVIGSYASDLFPIGGTFYPPSDDGTRASHVEVPLFAVFRDVLYFPMPPGGVEGMLTLRTALPDGESIDVRFVADIAGTGEAYLERP